MAKVNIADLNRVEPVEMNKLSEKELAAIKGGIDLAPAARDIFRVIGRTAGDAISTGLGDLLL